MAPECETDRQTSCNGIVRAMNTGSAVKKYRFSTNISLYFENDTIYGHSYNGRLIGTRMRSIEWCHFQ